MYYNILKQDISETKMFFERHRLSDLRAWQRQKSRLPLLIRGARQVGKTALVREWARQDFPRIHEFNFQKNKSLCPIFSSIQSAAQLIRNLEIISESSIDPRIDLIFLDEIQDCPEALNALKYIAEELPNTNFVAAGSLLGVYLSNSAFPVGKVEFLDLFPMDYHEFLLAIGKDQLAALLMGVDKSATIAFHDEFCRYLREFYVVGGLPAVVKIYRDSQSLAEMRKMQDLLLQSYRGDFAKYSGPIDALRILSVFEGIPKQLAKDNRKFQFNVLQPGARYSNFANAVQWLVSAGLCYKIPILEHVEIPLKVHVRENIFKIYFFDIGLLGALAELPISAFLDSSALFTTFKGAFSENVVLNEYLAHHGHSVYSWQGKTSEVDFLLQKEGSILPIEVKSGLSGKLKSLQFFSQKYKVAHKVRCSLLPYQDNPTAQFRNYPIYLAQFAAD
jgi:predicted AAA+ superfamily ATPase